MSPPPSAVNNCCNHFTGRRRRHLINPAVVLAIILLFLISTSQPKKTSSRGRSRSGGRSEAALSDLFGGDAPPSDDDRQQPGDGEDAGAGDTATETENEGGGGGGGLDDDWMSAGLFPQRPSSKKKPTSDDSDVCIEFERNCTNCRCDDRCVVFDDCCRSGVDSESSLAGPSVVLDKSTFECLQLNPPAAAKNDTEDEEEDDNRKVGGPTLRKSIHGRTVFIVTTGVGGWRYQNNRTRILSPVFREYFSNSLRRKRPSDLPKLHLIGGFLWARESARACASEKFHYT